MVWLLFLLLGLFFLCQQIVFVVWGVDVSIVECLIEQYIYKLCKKLQFGFEIGVEFKIVYVCGYQFVVQVVSNELVGFEVCIILVV